MANRIEFEQWVPFPIARVFSFFSNPENLPRIMPSASGTRLTHLARVAPPGGPSGESNDKAAGVGSRIFTSFRIFPGLPFRAEWIARITEFEWNHHFADVQEKGPFKTWHHRHEFRSSPRSNSDGTIQDGTTIRDVIDYEVGFGILGTIGNVLFVQHQMSNTFAERQRKLPELLSQK